MKHEKSLHITEGFFIAYKTAAGRRLIFYRKASALVPLFFLIAARAHVRKRFTRFTAVTRIFRINMIIRDKAAVSQHRKRRPLSGKQIIAELNAAFRFNAEQVKQRRSYINLSRGRSNRFRRTVGHPGI